MQFPSPADHGLGDRFGQYLQLSTIAELKKIELYTRWQTTANVWSATYPDDILKYVKFPKRLHIVNDIDKRLSVLQNVGPGYQEGFDHIPETSYAMLMSTKIIPKVSQIEYMRAFHHVASQFVFLRQDMLPTQPYAAIHLRRGDRGGSMIFSKHMRNIIPKDSRFVVLSDSLEAKRQACKWVNCLVLPKVDKREHALQEFFTLRHAKYIVQSVQQTGRLGGWSSFSFVPSVMGNVTLFPFVPRNTRLETAQIFCKCKLFNVQHNLSLLSTM